MSDAFDQIIASYHGARETGQLFDTFYLLFLAKSLAVRPMFARTRLSESCFGHFAVL